jgi:hypothetical protein
MVRSLAVNTGRWMGLRQRITVDFVLIVWALVLSAVERLISFIHEIFLMPCLATKVVNSATR